MRGNLTPTFIIGTKGGAGAAQQRKVVKALVTGVYASMRTQSIILPPPTRINHPLAAASAALSNPLRVFVIPTPKTTKGRLMATFVVWWGGDYR
jgi:hypothetical protein